MSAAENKTRLQAIYADLATGDTRSFRAALHPDFVWTITGSNSWSGRYGPGFAKVQDGLLRPLYARFAGRYTNQATRFLAEHDVVMVACRGNVATVEGERYDNDYCLLFRFADGLIVEEIEYMDSALAERVLGPLPEVLERFAAQPV